ncbi:hypothetical protein [Ciceribacter selenitireducens]
MAMDAEFTENRIPDEILKGIMAPVGLVIVHWPMIEQCLAFQIEALAGLAAKNGIDPERQGPVGDRIKALRRFYRRIPEVAPMAPRALELLQHARNFQTLRDTLAHGALSAYLADEQLLIFTHIKPSKDKSAHETMQRMVKLSDITAASKYAVGLAREFHEFTDSICERFWVEPTES